MNDGLDAVRRICEGWNEMTLEDWREICTPDVAYQNMPWDRTVVTGPDAIHETLETFARTFDVRMEVRHLDGNDTVAFSERVEHFSPRPPTAGPGDATNAGDTDAGDTGAGGTAPKEPFDLPVTGVFELRDGRVSAWRDYFDRRAMKA